MQKIGRHALPRRQGGCKNGGRLVRRPLANELVPSGGIRVVHGELRRVRHADVHLDLAGLDLVIQALEVLCRQVLLVVDTAVVANKLNSDIKN